MTVDKPPLGLWLQALSVMAFGLNSFELIFPSAFAGSMSAMLLYFMVKKVWGEIAGLIGAAIVLTDDKRGKLNNIVFWCAWLLPMEYSFQLVVFFSIGGFIHRNFVVMICPAIAALMAIAATSV